jgi:hypothetical protein
MYRDRLIDAMAQIYFDIDDDTFKSYLDRAGIDFICASSIPQGKITSLRFKENFGDRFLLGTTKRFDQRIDFTDQYVSEIMQELENPIYKFIGELHFTHADKEDGEVNQELERHVNASSPNVRKLLDHISKNPVPVYFHWEVFHWERDWPNIKDMLNSYPNLTFIWPHCGFATVDQIETVLNGRPNVYGTLSKRELKRWKNLWISADNRDFGGYQIINSDWWDKVDKNSIVDDDYKIREEWSILIDKFQDRLLFATDAHKIIRWKHYVEIVESWRKILDQLDNIVAKKISYENAARIYNLK